MSAKKVNNFPILIHRERGELGFGKENLISNSLKLARENN